MGNVAVGDSIVNADQSWAHWLSATMGQPLRRVSVNGSLSDDVVRHQLPLLAGQHYAVACVTVGTNDILFDWDADTYADNLATIVAAASASAERVVVQTIPLALAAFPGSASEFRRRVRRANAAIRACGAMVLAGEDLRGPRHLIADRIHPSLAGHLLLADRAAALLGVTPPPSGLHDGPLEAERSLYYLVTANEVPRRVVKRVLGRPIYRLPAQSS